MLFSFFFLFLKQLGLLFLFFADSFFLSCLLLSESFFFFVVFLEQSLFLLSSQFLLLFGFNSFIASILEGGALVVQVSY
jgi:hypothetical protein